MSHDPVCRVSFVTKASCCRCVAADQRSDAEDVYMSAKLLICIYMSVNTLFPMCLIHIDTVHIITLFFDYSS